jgi:hypothetical protein
VAYFARVEEYTVAEVVVVDDSVITVDGQQKEELGQAFLNEIKGGTWYQCFIDGEHPERGPYPSIGWGWNGNKFIAPPNPLHPSEA